MTAALWDGTKHTSVFAINEVTPICTTAQLAHTETLMCHLDRQRTTACGLQKLAPAATQRDTHASNSQKDCAGKTAMLDGRDVG